MYNDSTNEKAKKMIDKKTEQMDYMIEQRDGLGWQIEDLKNDIREIYKGIISEFYEIDYEQIEEWDRLSPSVIDMYIAELNEGEKNE